MPSPGPAEPQVIRTHAANDFAHATVTTRLPRNIRNIIAGHPEWDRSILLALEDLACGIESDGPIPEPPLPAWDADRWHAAWYPHRDETWHDAGWFFAETYAFRLILDAARYFSTGRDPFGPMKARELASGAALEPIRRWLAASAADGPPPGRETPAGAPAARELAAALELSTWGNRADISFVAGGDVHSTEGEGALLLVNDTERVLKLAASGLSSVHIVMDNSGAELAGDLVLTLVLLRYYGAQVVLHPKFYPTYVSDTIPADIHIFLDTLAQDSPEAAAVAEELRRAVGDGRLRIAPDPFWCETEFLTDLPRRLSTVLAGADLVIVKGDFNYRRAMRDTIWHPGVTAAGAMGLAGSQDPQVAACAAVPWLFLRTMKSDCLAGVDAGTVASLDRDAPGWRTDGRRAVMQLV